MKTIQKIKAWSFPCDCSLEFAKVSGELFVSSWSGIYKTKKELSPKSGCACMNGCKPQRIVITVEVDE